MNSFIFRSIIFVSSASIFSSASILSTSDNSCDFCPEPATIDSDDFYCNELLRLARVGNLYDDEEECDLNVPILAKRCKCSAPPPPRHAPCDPCDAGTASIHFDADDHPSTTITNPGGRLIFKENKYSCIEMMYSARNGGLSPSNCEALSISEVASTCGRCVETERCDIDEAMCRPSQTLVASNPMYFPGRSNLWSTALTCEALIEGARNGDLLTGTGCNTIKNSIAAAFQPGAVGLGVADLKMCALQCNYDKAAATASEQIPSIQIQTDNFLIGRIGSDNLRNSDMPSDGPSLQPSDGPSLQPSELPNLQSELPSDGPSMITGDMIEDLSKDINLTGTTTLTEPTMKKSPRTGIETCLMCDFDNDSAFYLYKDFGQAGVTFFEALSAPDHRAECKDPNGPCETKNPLYPDLDNCYLADVAAFDDLIGIQAVIPPKKAAYIAVYKDTVAQFEDAKTCSESLPELDCVVENYKQNLAYGYGKGGDDEEWTQISMDDDNDSCSELKEGWVNYGSDIAIPSDIWKKGQPSYCYSGPIQNAAAVWPVQPNGYNYGDMRDVNAGWKLPGAVYKCCKSLHTCSLSTSTN